MTIRAVIFDLDDTLVAQEATDRDVCRLVCGIAEKCCGVESDILAEIVLGRAEHVWRESLTYDYCASIGIGASEGLHGSFPGDSAELSSLRAWLPEYRRLVWTGALAACGVRDETMAAEMATLFETERNARSDVYVDAEPVLRQLKGGFLLGLLTNGASQLQRRKLQASGLKGYFRETVISGEVGVGKPDPRVFQLVIAGLGVTPDEAVMVGDNLVRDVGGAIGAGLHAVWLNRDGARGNESYAEIRSLQELPALLPRIR
jgi:putative hydrolase of the HAD superfamily